MKATFSPVGHQRLVSILSCPSDGLTCLRGLKDFKTTLQHFLAQYIEALFDAWPNLLVEIKTWIAFCQCWTDAAFKYWNALAVKQQQINETNHLTILPTIPSKYWVVNIILPLQVFYLVSYLQAMFGSSSSISKYAGISKDNLMLASVKHCTNLSSHSLASLTVSKITTDKAT